MLFDGYDDQDDDIATTDSKGDKDLNSMMDRGLEEVDDLLSIKGRLSAFGPAQDSSKEKLTGENLSATAPALNGPRDGLSNTAAKHSPNEGAVQTKDDVAESSAGSTRNQQDMCARGTGAHAASVLMSATAPPGSAYPDNVASSPASPTPTRREGATPSGRDGTVYHDGALDVGEGACARRRDGVRSYDYKARKSGDGVVAGNVLSPPRRRAKGATPFIQAKDVTLTYAQAKLFGLAGSSCPGARPTPSGLDVSRTGNTTWPGSGSRQPRDYCSTGTGRVGRTPDGHRGQRHHKHAGNRTYSPSRMEHLAQPAPGRGRVSDSTTPAAGWSKPDGHHRERGRGGEAQTGNEPTFTWKRSKKAEAAMRWAMGVRSGDTKMSQQQLWAGRVAAL